MYACTNTQLLIREGYTRITLQIGKGTYKPPTPTGVPGITVEYYGFKPSLQDDMKNADLIISHGGEKELNHNGDVESSDQGGPNSIEAHPLK